MKIFVIEKNGGAHNKAATSALYHVDGLSVALRPDSALLTGGKPFFVPDDLGRVEGRAAVALRVCRLGKAVAPRFARRYYNAATVAVCFTASDLLSDLFAAGKPLDLSTGFDGAVALGRWVETLPDDFSVGVADVDEAIAGISQWFTLKTGDLLLFLSDSAATETHIGDHVEGWFDGQKVLEFNCK